MAAPLAEPEAALVFAVEATVFVEATELLTLELFVTEDASVEEVTDAVDEVTDAVDEVTDAVAPPTPDGCVSKSVVEPVAQLITSPNPAAKAPIP